MNWESLRSPIRATFKNCNFQSFLELGKSSKYNIRPPIFKNSNFEFKNELSFAVKSKKGNLQ